MPRIFEDPIISLVEPNEDGTADHQIGSFSPFNVVVTSNSFASTMPAERIGDNFYGFGETLSSDVVVEVTR